MATFDRELAIRRADAEFLALGHPFVDALLEYVGTYDFGGLCAIRQIREPQRSGQAGYFFLFVVRERIAREDADECLFRFEPVFVTSVGQIDQESLGPAMSEEAVQGSSPPSELPDPDAAFRAARSHLEEKARIWEWVDDIEFLAMSFVQFI